MTQMVKNPPAVQETWVQSLRQEDPLEKRMATSILDWTEKVGYSQWGQKELDMTEPLTAVT